MTIFNLIIAWLFVMAAYLLWWKFREDRLHGRNFFNFGDLNFLIASLTVLVVVWGSFSILKPEPHFTDAEKQIEVGLKTRQPWLVTDALWKKIKHDSLNPDLHFALIENHFIQQSDHFSIPDLEKYGDENRRLFSYYSNLSEKENDPELNDLGYLFLADYCLENSKEDLQPAEFYLRQVKNKDRKYFNYISGKVLQYTIGPIVSENCFLDEIRLNGYKKGAWEELAMIYDFTGRTEQLKKLIYDPQSAEFIPTEYRYKTYFLNNDIFLFYKARFGKLMESLTLWGFLGDVLILFTWLFFLRRLSFISPIKWRHFFLAIGIGALLAMFSWLLYEFYHYVLHFWTNGNIGNDFLFSFLGIGFIEELVKLIPFLILLHFTNIIKKPVDYLLIASAAGLGFAFFENLLYISQYGLDVIHSRALTASVSHMASSAIVAYGFVLAKYRYAGKNIFIPIFFTIAVMAHGFYDFWLLNDKVHSLAIVTLFFFLSEMLVYVSFLNNALNQSVDELSSNTTSALNTQRLAAFIAGALILVFVLEYTGTCFVYGTSIGNKTLMNAFFSGGYLIFFLSVRLSNITILPKQWSKIQFFRGILPSEILGGKKQDHNSVVGLELTFHNASSKREFPLQGIVKKRLTISGYAGWFEVELKSALFFNEQLFTTIYIRAQDATDLIRKEEETSVEVFVRWEEGEKSNLIFVENCFVK